MATTWIGNAIDRKQVDSITPANVGIGNTFTCTINGKAVTVTATAATVANVTALLTAAWNASTIPEFVEVIATDSTTLVTLTARVAGTPFTVTSSAAGGTATNTRAAVTANSSRSDWSNTANWSGGVVPVSTDDVIFDGAVSNTSALYILEQSAVVLASLSVINDYTGFIGAPTRNATVTTNTYNEYRSTELAIGATAILVRCSSNRIRLNCGTNQFTLTIAKSGTSQDGLPPVQIRGTHASNAITASGGTLGVAVIGSHVATVATLSQSGGALTMGEGVTLGAVTKTGGTLTASSNPTSIINEGGEFFRLRA